MMKLIYTLLILLFSCSLANGVTIDASRTTGVAPLSVHFYDSDNVVASSGALSTLHTYHYTWSFDDTEENWGNTGNSKNSATGPITAHVFESSGTHTVTLTVINSSTGVAVGTDTVTVTVTDPEVAYDPTVQGNTFCISDSTNADFTGCPSAFAADHITTDDISDLSSYSGSNTRTLFHRGSSWDLTSAITWGTFGTTDPKTVGAYGTCTSPDDLGICTNAPQVTITVDTGIQFMVTTYKVNTRVMDISVSATANTYSDSGVFKGTNNIKDFLALRVKGSDVDLAMSHSSYRQNDTDYPDKIALVSCSFTDTYTNTLYVGAERLALMGNVLADDEISHVCRIWHSYLGVFSNNNISGASIANTQARHALKMHGPVEDDVGTYAETSSGGIKTRTRFNVVSDNIFGGSGWWTVAIEPQSTTYDDRNSDLIFERNKILAGYGTLNATPPQVGAMFSVQYLSVRNNIIDGTDGFAGYTGIKTGRRGVEPDPQYVSIYNNTIYRGDSQTSDSTGVTISSGVTNAIAINNYVSFPSVTGTTLAVSDLSGTAVTSNNVHTDDPYLVDPDNISPLLRDFNLTVSSVEAIDMGTTVPVAEDFLGATRIGEVYDLGAYEGFGVAATCSTSLSVCTILNCESEGGGYWYDDTCNATAEETSTCDGTEANVALCTETECTTYSWYYYNSTCNLTEQVVSTGDTIYVTSGGVYVIPPQ